MTGRLFLTAKIPCVYLKQNFQMSDTTASKNAFQFLMSNKKSKNDVPITESKTKKRKIQNVSDQAEETKTKKQKIELSLIVKDETGIGNENSESVFNKLAPKPASSFSPKKNKAKKGAKLSGPTAYTNKICHLLQIRSGNEVTWSTVFLEAEADEEGKDKIDQLTTNKFLELIAEEEGRSDGTETNTALAQLPNMPNFCWYWKRAFNCTTVATFGTEQPSPVRQPKTRQVHPTSLNKLSHDDVARDIDDYRSMTWECETGPVQVRNCFGQNRHLEVRLTSNVALNERSVDLMDSSLPSNNSWSCRLSPSILKSLLQKTIRRSRPEAAVRIALQLIKISFMEYIRRIIIIMFEDAILHPSLPVLTWLLMANIDNFHEEEKRDEEAGVINFGPGSTTFKKPPSYYNLSLRRENTLSISPELLNYALQIAYDLASVRFRDTCDVHVAPPSDMNEHAGSGDEMDERVEQHETWPNIQHLAQLKPFEASLVLCILIRSSFGGMTGDMIMLRQYAKLWHARFKREHPLPPMIASDNSTGWLAWLNRIHCLKSPVAAGRAFVDYHTLGPIMYEDCLLAGIDFHCSPMLQQLLEDKMAKRMIDEFMLEKFSSVSETETHLRHMVWWFRSSINNKVSIYPDLERSDVQKEHDTKMTLFHLFGQLTYKLDLISSQLFRRAVYRLRPPKNNNNINDTANPTPAK